MPKANVLPIRKPAAQHTNVIPFAPRSTSAAPYRLFTIVVKNEPPEPGELVAFHFENPESCLIGLYEGMTGRDYAGRFVKKGSEEETLALGPMHVSKRHLADGHITIVGTVINGAWPAGELFPPSA